MKDSTDRSITAAILVSTKTADALEAAHKGLEERSTTIRAFKCEALCNTIINNTHIPSARRLLEDVTTTNYIDFIEVTIISRSCIYHKPAFVNRERMLPHVSHPQSKYSA